MFTQALVYMGWQDVVNHSPQETFHKGGEGVCIHDNIHETVIKSVTNVFLKRKIKYTKICYMVGWGLKVLYI